MRVLAGDVGGTKTLLAVASVHGDAVEIISEARYESRAHTGLAPIVRDFLVPGSFSVEGACFGVPGPVVGGTCRTPNLPWLTSAEELARDTGLARVRLINDFAAAALGVLALEPASLAVLQEGRPHEHGTRAVLGAGTGFGQAILFWDGARYRVNPGEAGHGGFAAQGKLQHELVLQLEERNLPVSVERILSGPGLLRIYRFLLSTGVSTSPEVEAALDHADAGQVIGDYAARGVDACQQTIALFLDAYGAEAGSLALRALAEGGVYVAGGIAPKVLPFIRAGSFMDAFRRKGRLSALMRSFPVAVVLEPKVGLLGAALEAARLAGSQ
jgi:glucokinase